MNGPARAIRLLLAGLVLAQGTAAAAAFNQRLIVRFDDAADPARHQISAARRTLVGRLAGQPVENGRRLASGAELYQLRHPLAAEEAERLAERIAAQPGVRYAHPDYRRYVTQAVVPADPDFFRQWYLFAAGGNQAGSINAEPAWSEFTTGERSDAFRPVVAVLDSGLRPHPELVARLATDGSGPAGYDFISADRLSDGGTAFATANDGDGRDPDPEDPGDWMDLATIDQFPELFGGDPDAGIEPCEVRDSSWHGTVVAGIVGAEPDSSGTVGIHFDARILPVRVLGRCGGYVSDIADAIRWAAGLNVEGVPGNQARARVINLSFGSPGRCTAEEQAAIDAAIQTGALVVVAAGNQAANAGSFSPGNCRNVLTVAATTRKGYRTRYTNYDISSNVIALSAPGGDGGLVTADNIYAPTDIGAASPAGNDFAFFAGTSFAAPMVSGAAALMLSLNDRLSPSCLYDDLLASTRPFPTDPSKSNDPACSPSECGAGLLDTRGALARVAARGPGDCGSSTLVGGGSNNGGGAGLWLSILLGGVGLSRIRAGWSKRPCRSR